MKREVDYNKIYKSNNYGEFKVLKELPKGKLLVQFLDTGTVCEVVKDCALVVGNIKDKYRKTICGVACIGNASSYHKAYNMWLSIIHRCYDKSYASYDRYGGRGVRVCDRWHCFEYFVEDLPYIDGYENWIRNSKLFNIDKDLKQQHLPHNKRIYSLETCCFIQSSDNVAVARIDKRIKQNSEITYIGVQKRSNITYEASMHVNGNKLNLGSYDTPELAAAAYNNMCKCMYKDRQIINNVPYIDPEELDKYNKRTKPTHKPLIRYI